MTSKFLKRAGASLALLVLFTSVAAPALADTAYIYSYGNVGGTQFGTGYDYVDPSGNVLDAGGVLTSYTSGMTQQQKETASRNAVSARIFNDWGVLIPPGDIQGLGISSSTVQSLINTSVAAATSSITVPRAMSFTNPTRSLNTAFQVSTTSAAFVSYTVDVATSLSLSGGTTGTVTLQYADDSGFTTNVKTVQSSVNGQTGTLTIGLGLNQTSTAAVTGMIPVSKYVKIVTANTTGTPTFTYRAAQEVLLPSN